jgi:hypothetical protein
MTATAPENPRPRNRPLVARPPDDLNERRARGAVNRVRHRRDSRHRTEGRVMPIKPFLPNVSFDPEVITLMGVAFEKACRSLQGSGRTISPEVIAKRIIELARKGERDPARMSEETLKSMRMGG